MHKTPLPSQPCPSPLRPPPPASILSFPAPLRSSSPKHRHRSLPCTPLFRAIISSCSLRYPPLRNLGVSRGFLAEDSAARPPWSFFFPGSRRGGAGVRLRWRGWKLGLGGRNSWWDLGGGDWGSFDWVLVVAGGVCSACL